MPRGNYDYPGRGRMSLFSIQKHLKKKRYIQNGDTCAGFCRVSSWSSPCHLLQMLNIGYYRGFWTINCIISALLTQSHGHPGMEKFWYSMSYVYAFHLCIAFKWNSNSISCVYQTGWLAKLFSTNLDQVCRLYAYSRDVTVLPWPVSMIRKWPPHLRSWSRSIIPNICKTLHFGMVMKTSDEDLKEEKIPNSRSSSPRSAKQDGNMSFHPLKPLATCLNWTHFAK